MLMRILLILLTSISLTFSSLFLPSDLLAENWNRPASQVRSEDFKVEFFPVAPYHVGDLISVRVTYTGPGEIGNQEITLQLADQPGLLDTETSFSDYSQQAIFYWVLDTSNFQPGFLEFNFEIPEEQLSWQQGINLLSKPGNRHGQWANEQMDCCTIYYITGTDAEEDLPTIKKTLEEETQKSWAEFSNLEVIDQPDSHNPLTVVLVPVVIGHGGFATDKAVITYSNNNWAGADFDNLIHHEVVHVIDRQINSGPRPSMLAEGLAVYLSGGHYREGEPIPRAASLYAMGMYLPIVDIVDDFYAAQHEIGYMEAAALVAYMVDRWGWEDYIDFYFNLPEGDHDSQIISNGLEEKFGLELAELEADFITALQDQEPDGSVLKDVRLTIEAYDMLRRYQSLIIPSANFRTAWWPPIDPMLENGIVDDYTYREKSPFNVIVEGIFVEMFTYLKEENYQVVEKNLTKIATILDSVSSSNQAFSHYDLGWPLPVPSILPIEP